MVYLVSAIWHDSGAPSIFAPPPVFSFDELPEIHVEAPAPYAEAMVELHEIEAMRGAVWYRHNAELAHKFWLAKKPWWLF